MLLSQSVTTIVVIETFNAKRIWEAITEVEKDNVVYMYGKLQFKFCKLRFNLKLGKLQSITVVWNYNCTLLVPHVAMSPNGNSSEALDTYYA